MKRRIVSEYYSVQEGYAAPTDSEPEKVIYGSVLETQAKAYSRNEAEPMFKNHASRCKQFYAQEGGVKCKKVRLVRVVVEEIKEVDL